MSSDRRFEQELPGLLEDLLLGPMPTYRDRVLDRATRARQRPAWSIPERWLSMVDIARRPVLAPRLPWRTVGLALLVLALTLALVAVLVAGRRPNVPPPFGPAANGLVAYASGNDIYTANLVTGVSSAIVRGPEVDRDPTWSRDGTRLAFARAFAVFVARPDGSGLTRINPEPLAGIDNFTFSPDGTEILIEGRIDVRQVLLVAAADGSALRQLDLDMQATAASWRPDGTEILFMGTGQANNGAGDILAVSPKDGSVRTVLKESHGRNRGFPTWSPDGSRISYVEWVDADDLTAQTHVMLADGTGDRVLPTPADAKWQAGSTWSNDGTRILVIRGFSGGYEASRPFVVPVDGSGTGTEIHYPGIANPECCAAFEWAPDDTWILATPTDTNGTYQEQVLLDPIAGTTRTLPWNSTSEPSVQRVAR